MIVVTVDKQTGNDHRPAGDHHPRLRRTERARPDHRGRDRAGRQADREPGRPHQRDRPAQGADQGRRLALPVRADEAAADGLPGRGRGLDGDASADGQPAPRHRPSVGTTRGGRRRAVAHAGGPRISPDVARSLVGIALLVLGVITLMALLLPGAGTLTDWSRNAVAPWLRHRALAAAAAADRGRHLRRAAKGVGARLGRCARRRRVSPTSACSACSRSPAGRNGGRIGQALDGVRSWGRAPSPGSSRDRRAFVILAAGDRRRRSCSRSTGRCRPCCASSAAVPERSGDTLVSPADPERWRPSPSGPPRPPAPPPGRRPSPTRWRPRGPGRQRSAPAAGRRARSR